MWVIQKSQKDVPADTELGFRQNNEFIAVLAATDLHISASISDQNHSTKWLFKCLWWTATNIPRHIFFHSYLLQIHQPAVPTLWVRNRHISCQADYLLRSCRMFIVYHLVLHILYDLWLVVNRNGHLKVSPYKLLKMFIIENNH